MGRIGLPGPLETRNCRSHLIVQEPRRESLTFGDPLDLDGNRFDRDLQARQARITDRLLRRPLVPLSFGVPDCGICYRFDANSDRSANTYRHEGHRCIMIHCLLWLSFPSEISQ